MGKKLIIRGLKSTNKKEKKEKEDNLKRESNKLGDGSKLSEIRRKRELTKQEQELYDSKKPKYESSNNEVNEVALRIAERFTFKEIFDANDSPKKAPHVHGWIQDNYRNFQWLIDNYVLEVASFYAKNKLEHKVDIIKILEGIPLRDYVCSRLELEKPKELINYPDQPFINILFMSEVHLDDALLWIEDAEWVIDGEDVRINLGRFGGELIAWISWNIPVILVTYIPFKNKGIFKAKLEAQDLKDVVIDKRLKLIHTYRTMVETLEAKVDEKTREAKQWKKMYSDYKKDITLETRKQIAKIQYLKGNKNNVIKRTYNINYILIVAIVILLIITIIGWIF